MAIGWWANCDDCGVKVVVDGDGQDVPEVGEWDSFPSCPVCGATLHFDEMPETMWNRETRLMKNAAERAMQVATRPAFACPDHFASHPKVVSGTGPDDWVLTCPKGGETKTYAEWMEGSDA